MEVTIIDYKERENASGDKFFVLIVEGDSSLSEVWKRHLVRQGADVTLAASQAEAVDQTRGTIVYR